MPPMNPTQPAKHSRLAVTWQWSRHPCLPRQTRNRKPRPSKRQTRRLAADVRLGVNMFINRRTALPRPRATTVATADSVELPMLYHISVCRDCPSRFHASQLCDTSQGCLGVSLHRPSTTATHSLCF